MLRYKKCVQTLLCLKWMTGEKLLYSTQNSAQCYVAAWMGGGLGENGYVYMMTEFLSCSSEAITTLLIDYTPIQKFKRIKNVYRDLSIRIFISVL